MIEKSIRCGNDAEEELKRMKEFRKAQAEIEKKMMQKRYRGKCLK